MADEWTVVQVLESDEEAQLVAGFLRSRGIECQVESSHSKEFPVTVGSLGVVRIEVPAAEAERARGALAEYGSAAALPAEAMVDEPAEGEAT